MPTLPPNDFGISKTKALSDQTDFRFNKFLTEFLLCERRYTVLRDPRRAQLYTPTHRENSDFHRLGTQTLLPDLSMGDKTIKL